MESDLSKKNFFSKTVHKPCYLQSNKLCIIIGTAGTLFMKIHFLLDLNGQIKVTISENSIYMDMLGLIYHTIVICNYLW